MECTTMARRDERTRVLLPQGFWVYLRVPVRTRFEIEVDDLGRLMLFPILYIVQYRTYIHKL